MVIQSGLLVSVMVSSGFAGNGDGLLAIAVLLLGLLMKKDAQDRKAWIHIIARKCMELLAAINPKLQSEGYFKNLSRWSKKRQNRISLVKFSQVLQNYSDCKSGDHTTVMPRETGEARKEKEVTKPKGFADFCCLMIC
jgi:hypothetical protein